MFRKEYLLDVDTQTDTHTEGQQIEVSWQLLSCLDPPNLYLSQDALHLLLISPQRFLTWHVYLKLVSIKHAMNMCVALHTLSVKGGWGLVQDHKIFFFFLFSLFLAPCLIKLYAADFLHCLQREISLWTSKRLQLGHHKTLQSARAQSLVWDTSLLSLLTLSSSVSASSLSLTRSLSLSLSLWYQWN